VSRIVLVYLMLNILGCDVLGFIGLIKSNMRIAFNVSAREEDQTAAFSAKRGMRIWRPALALLTESITDLQNTHCTDSPI